MLLAVLLFFELHTHAQGCSQCRAQIESSQDEDLTVGNGINVAILCLMLFPYLILFFIFRKKIVGLLRELRALWR